MASNALLNDPHGADWGQYAVNVLTLISQFSMLKTGLRCVCVEGESNKN